MEGNGSKSRNPSGNQEGEKGPAKSNGGNLDKLSREELIAKCRNLAMLAQRAKSAKDEATNEHKKLKATHENAVAEADALREMVADLTEGKIAYTTKVESLQRQLKLSTSEVESMRDVEQDLLKERQQLIAENSQLAEEKQSCQEKLNSSFEKFKLLESAWEKESLALEEEVENLEAQNGQVDILKTKCKKLLEEKTGAEDELQKQQKLVAKSVKLEGEVKLLKEEKKADAIILEASRSDKKKLESKLKSFENQVATLQREKEERKNNELDIAKTKVIEEELNKQKLLLCDSETFLKEVQGKLASLEQEREHLQGNVEETLKDKEHLQVTVEGTLKDKEHLQATVEETLKDKEAANHEVNLLKDQLNSMAENHHQMEEKIANLVLENGNLTHKYSAEIDAMKTELLKARDENKELLDNSSQTIQEEKMQSLEKMKQLEAVNGNLEEQVNLLEMQLKEKSEQNDHLTGKLKGKDSEISNVTKKLTRLEEEKIKLADKSKGFEDTVGQVKRLEEELESIASEKVEISRKCENLETDVRLLKEKLDNAEKRNQDFENQISKYASDANSKLKEDDMHKQNLDKLSSEITNLKSSNDELAMELEQLRKDIKANEFVLNELNSSGNLLLSMCRKLYPSSQSFLSTEAENDVGQIMKGIMEILNLVASKQIECKYEENLDSVIESLERFQTHCKNQEALCTESEWSLHAECFEKLSKSLINFSKSVTFAMDGCKEKSSQLEGRCFDVASVYKKFCENLKQEFVKLDNLRQEFDRLNKEKLTIEECLSEASKEKTTLKEMMDQIQVKLVASEKRCVEFETRITSGDSEKSEIVKNLQEQVLELDKEKDELSEKFKEMQGEKSNLEKLIKNQNEEIEKISSERDVSLQEKKVTLAEKEQIESTLENLKSQSTTKQKCLMDEKQDLEKKLTMLSEEKINLEKEFASLNADRRSLEEDSDKEKKSINDKVKGLLEEKATWQQEKEKLHEENKNLQEEVVKLQTRIDELNVEVHHLQDKVQTTELIIQTLKNEKDSSEKELKEAQNQNVQLNYSLETSSNRCEELLSELNDMNKVLRERGERISRLEATNKEKTEQLEATKTQLGELHHKMSSNEAELASKQEQLQAIAEKLHSFSSDVTIPSPSSNSQEMTKLEERVKELEQEKCALNKTIQELENDLQLARENGGPCHDGQSEVMSTSTISRAEDSQRMKELEDTFEERYMKLKSVAIRLKKRVAELTAQLNSSEESRSKLAFEREDLKKKVDGGGKDCVKATSKNIQIMQGEIDRLQDEVDSKKKELKECGKQLNSAAEQLSQDKFQLAESQEENGTLLKTLKNQEENLVILRDECSSLRGQISALEKRIAAESDQQVAVEERRKKAEERMEEERRRASQYAKELEEAKQETKNKSLMDLEMRDYELTVEDLNNKLSEKDTTIIELQADIVREKGRSNSLQDQLTHLTAQEATERERAEKLKKLLLENKTQLAELRQTQDVQTTAQENDRITIEELTQELEKQKMVLSDISIDKTKLEDVVRKTKSTSERRIETLEEQLLKYMTEATQLRTELDAIKKEFEGYKLRATSVLRQKARAPEVDVNELKGEKDQLQDDYEAAHLRIQQLQSELSALRAEHSFLQSEKEGVSRQVSSLTDDLNKRETLHRERVTSLESKMDAKIVEYQLIIASMSSQNETLSNSFKKQLESMRQTHTREIEHLTVKLEDSEDKLWQLKNTISTSVTPTNGNSNSGLAAAHPMRSEPDHGSVVHNHSSHHRRQPSSHGVDEPKIDVSNMVREEGEGSEWVEPVHRSPSRPGGYSPPPLEQLISSPLPSNVGLPPQEDTLSIASITTDATTKEISRLESKVSSSEMRIHQVTTLLHESEAENAKLAQLSDVLKEEIRRSSRNENREKHMENMEYMKNIILKFLVMKDGEERKHMVPVLKTVLQLSPQESTDLENFAVGGDDGGNNLGWGSYLHLWSSR